MARWKISIAGSKFQYSEAVNSDMATKIWEKSNKITLQNETLMGELCMYVSLWID